LGPFFSLSILLGQGRRYGTQEEKGAFVMDCLLGTRLCTMDFRPLTYSDAFSRHLLHQMWKKGYVG
jgi:hypothetical protein